MVAMSLLRPALGQGARAVLLRGSVIASRNQLASPPISAGSMCIISVVCLVCTRMHLLICQRASTSSLATLVSSERYDNSYRSHAMMHAQYCEYSFIRTQLLTDTAFS